MGKNLAQTQQRRRAPSSAPVPVPFGGGRAVGRARWSRVTAPGERQRCTARPPSPHLGRVALTVPLLVTLQLVDFDFCGVRVNARAPPAPEGRHSPLGALGATAAGAKERRRALCGLCHASPQVSGLFPCVNPPGCCRGEAELEELCASLVCPAEPSSLAALQLLLGTVAFPCPDSAPAGAGRRGLAHALGLKGATGKLEKVRDQLLGARARGRKENGLV